MGIEENKALVRRFMDLFSDARLDEAFELVAEDASWWMWGSGPAAGTYTRAAMKDLTAQSWQWFEGKVEWLPTGMTAEEDRVAVEARSNALTKGGYRHRNLYHCLFRVRDGRIVEVKEMFQEGPVTALFERLRQEAAS